MAVDLEVFNNSIGTSGGATLAADPGTSGTTLTLTTGHGARFPEILAGQRIRLRVESEIMIVTAHTAAADTMTVLRGQEDGSAGAAHAIGTPVNAVLTAEAQRRWAPSYLPQPRHRNMLLWTGPPEIAGAGNTPAAGVVYLTRAMVPEAMTLASMWYAVATAASTQSANVFMGVYTSAGTLLGKTANLATDVRTVGARSNALTVESGQSLTLVGGPDVYVWLAFLIGTQGTTAAQLHRHSIGSFDVQNAGFTTAPYWSQSLLTGQTSLPSTITPSNGARSFMWWHGVA